MRRSKYGAVKVVIDGFKFDSKFEARRYSELLLMQKAGLIKELELQPTFILQPTFKSRGETHRSIKYKGDFQYFDVRENCYVVEDAKSVATITSEFAIKWKLAIFQNPKIIFRKVIKK